MSDFDEDAVQNWEKLDDAATWREEHPYRECPHCGAFKFRALRRPDRSDKSLALGTHSYKERCKNCKYHGDEWKDDDD